MQIIKSLAISKIVLQATVLIVPDGFIKRLNKILFSFLWGSRDKVKRHKVIKKLNQGGLNMVDVESLFNSFKAQWINRILSCDHNNDKWSFLPLMYLAKFGDLEIIKQFNFDEDYCFSYIDNVLPFWRDVIKCYSKLNNLGQNIISFKNSIFTQQIWGNRYINIKSNRKKKVFFFKNWVESGFIYIKDLKFINGVLDCMEMYNLIDDKRNLLIELNIIRKAFLPFSLTLNQNQQNQALNTCNQNKAVYKNSKTIYNTLIEIKTSHITNMSTQVEFFKKPEVSSEAVFRDKLIIIKENKLREFNYKLMFNILPCNLNLKRWKVTDSDICDVCNNVQTAKHLLFDCSYVKPLWEVMESILGVTIEYSDIICGFHQDKCIFANYLSNICAYTIYKDYLIHSFDKERRPVQCNLHYFENEIIFRLDIYSKIGLKYM